MLVIYLSLLMLAALCTESTCSRNSRMTQSQNAVKHLVSIFNPLSVFLAISDGSKSSNTISNLNLQALINKKIISASAHTSQIQYSLRREKSQIFNSSVCTTAITVNFSD